MNNRFLKKTISNILILGLILAGLFFVLSRFIHLGTVEFTDNAQIHQHITPQNTRVQGFVKKIYFNEFQYVKKGDTLVIIEDTEFRLHLAQAKADLAQAEAGKIVTDASISTVSSNVLVNDAAIEEAQLQMENASKEFLRYKELLNQDAVTRQQYDNVKTTYDVLNARVKQMKRQRQSTENVKMEQSQKLQQNTAKIELAKAAVELARLNLSYTVITATCDGVTGRKAIQEGQLVQPGQNLVSIVDNKDIWVVANYRETQIKNIYPGNLVEIKADAIDGVVFKGVVISLSDATGASYSIIPSDNAAGNFVKVEQRVPVRIEFTKENKDSDLKRLRAGLNVECEVKY